MVFYPSPFASSCCDCTLCVMWSVFYINTQILDNSGEFPKNLPPKWDDVELRNWDNILSLQISSLIILELDR